MAWSLPEGGEPLKFLRPGHSPDLLKKLRRGQWRAEDELDLHGLNRIQAGYAVSDFLDEALSHDAHAAHAVHGKGLGVLREALRVDLPARAEVLGFVEAPPAQGGAGAVLVLLRA